MFTGIIQATGSVARLSEVGGDVRLLINAPALTLANASVGESIAVNGVCLTVTEFEGEHAFWMDVSRETLSCTTLADIGESDEVNLA